MIEKDNSNIIPLPLCVFITFLHMVIEFTRYHNAYMIHNETLYCSQNEEWRGNYSCLKVRLHFTRDKGFYYTTVFAPGGRLN